MLAAPSGPSVPTLCRRSYATAASSFRRRIRSSVWWVSSPVRRSAFRSQGAADRGDTVYLDANETGCTLDFAALQASWRTDRTLGYVEVLVRSAPSHPCEADVAASGEVGGSGTQWVS